MSATTDDVTLDIDALDAAAAKKAAEKDKKTANGDASEPTVVVDPEIASKTADAQTLTPDEGLKKLQKQLEDERTARIAAENRANESAQAEVKAKTEAQTSQLDLVKGAIDQLTQASDVLEAQYAEKAAAQDWAGAAKIQRQMAGNAAKLAQLEAGKTALEKAPKPTPRAPTDPVEAFCAQLSAPSAAWVRAHPDFVRDQRKNAQMIAAHELAVARGYKADTDEYFRSIEKTLEVGAPVKVPAHVDDPDDDPMASAAAQPVNGSRQAAPVAAPVSRSGNGTGANRSNTVKLTPDQIEMARASFPDSKTPLEDYARQVLILKKEGKLS